MEKLRAFTISGQSGLAQDKAMQAILEKIARNFFVPASTEEELLQGQAVLAYGFGFGPKKDSKPFDAAKQTRYNDNDFYPGKSNEDLADVICDILLKKDMPVFAAWEIAVPLEAKGISLPESNVVKLTEWGNGTYGYAKTFLERGAKSFDKIIVAAHPHHMRRAITTTQDVALEQRGRVFDAAYVPDVSNVRYDSESVQPWTTNMENFLPYEFANRLGFYLKNLAKHETGK